MQDLEAKQTQEQSYLCEFDQFCFLFKKNFNIMCCLACTVDD